MKYRLKYSKDLLYHNCLYAMCAQISAVPRFYSILPVGVYERSWSNINYIVQLYDHTDGIFSFDTQRDIVVGAFRNLRSQRKFEYPVKKALEFFEEADRNVCQLAERETLQYLLMGFKEQQKKKLFRKKTDEIVVPVVTSAFWSEGDALYSLDDESDFIKHGGEYVDKICVPKDELTEYLTDDYELTPDELDFAEKLFKLKLDGKSEVNRQLFSKICCEDSESYNEILSVLSDFHFNVV